MSHCSSLTSLRNLGHDYYLSLMLASTHIAGCSEKNGWRWKARAPYEATIVGLPYWIVDAFLRNVKRA